MNKKFIGVGLIVALAIVGSYFFPHSSKVTEVQQMVGAAGDTSSTGKVLTCVLDFSTTTPTTLNNTTTNCLTNNDGRDRVVTSVEYYIKNINGGVFKSNGGLLAALTWKLSTSTDVYVGNTNNFLMNGTAATTSAYNIGTTTSLVGSQPQIVWATGTNLNLFANGTTTDTTAVGVIIVRYVTGQ